MCYLFFVQCLAYLVLGILDCILADKFKLHQLQQLLCVGNSLKNGAEIDQGNIMVDRRQGSECVPLARSIRLALEKGCDEFRGIRDE